MGRQLGSRSTVDDGGDRLMVEVAEKGKVLLVDDEPNILDGFRRQLRKSHKIHCATGGAEALKALDSGGPFAVVVSDMQMPEMSGVDLLRKVREKNDQIVRIMLTGNAEQDTAVAAVNEGKIFRFLSKPCPPETLAGVLDEALEHHRTITAEAELLSKTLSGSVRMLTQVLSMAMPDAFGMSQEAKRLVRTMCDRIGIGPAWKAELAAMLMRIGCVTLPVETRKKYLRNERLSPNETNMIEETAGLGKELVGEIPRLEGVAQIIGEQFGPPDASTPILSQICRVVGDYQLLRGNGSPLEAIHRMDDPEKHDPDIVEVLAEVVSDMYRSEEVMVKELANGMILDSDVQDRNGCLLIAKGAEVHGSLMQKLVNLQKSGVGVREPIAVKILDKPSLYGENS